MDRAEHHAQQVKQVALAVAGGIVWRKDPNPIEVYTRSGAMANVLWVMIKGRRYAFKYNHNNGTIEMRLGSTRGRLMHSFTNATSIAEIWTFFNRL